MATIDSTPINSWNVYTIGEQNQRQHPLYRLRERYISTKDPLPNMCYRQLEKALPPSYDLPMGEEPMEGIESPPELLEEETTSVEEFPIDDTESPSELLEEETSSIEEFPVDSTETPPELLEEETTSVEESPQREEESPQREEESPQREEESPQREEESADCVSLSPAAGSIGDEITAEADRGIIAVTAVFVNGVQADFLCVDDAHLIFMIPEGATSGTVELMDSSGKVVKVGILEVISG